MKTGQHAGKDSDQGYPYPGGGKNTPGIFRRFQNPAVFSVSLTGQVPEPRFPGSAEAGFKEGKKSSRR
jgi:hypothetical protein